MSGTEPLFFSDDIIWESYFIESTFHETRLASQLATLNLDKRLAKIDSDLFHFTTSANIACQTGQKINPEIFQEVLISVQYRLMLIDFVGDELNELLRVGLLASSTTIFLQTQGIRIRFDKLSNTFKKLMCKFDCTNENMNGAGLWLLFTAAMLAVTHDDDVWLIPLLQKAVKAITSSSWKEVRARLKLFPWIDAIHDQDGRRVFDRVIAFKE